MAADRLARVAAIVKGRVLTVLDITLVIVVGALVFVMLKMSRTREVACERAA